MSKKYKVAVGAVQKMHEFFGTDYTEAKQMEFKQLHQFNVAVLGQANSGQTSFCIRLARQVFLPQKPELTFAKYVSHNVTKNIKLHLIDLLGQRQSYAYLTDQQVIRASHTAFVTFCAQSSWEEDLSKLIKTVRMSNSACRIILVGTKIDEAPLTPAATKKFAQFCASEQIQNYFFVSNCTGDGFDEINQISWPDNTEYQEIKIGSSGCC